jgi:hypothetical protein
MGNPNAKSGIKTIFNQLRNKQARMAVPKMVKNGNNSLFTIRNRFCYPFGIHALKTDPNSERRINTIFHQFRNTHARLFATYVASADKV